MAERRTVREIDAELREQTNERARCRYEIRRISGQVVATTAAIDRLLVERAEALDRGVMETAYEAIDRAELQGDPPATTD